MAAGYRTRHADPPAASAATPDDRRATRCRRAPRLARGREGLLKPRRDRLGDGCGDMLLAKRAVLVDFAGGRRREEMIDARHFHDVHGAVLPFLCHRLEQIGVLRLHLRIELALDDQDRLPHLFDQLLRVGGEEALHFAVVHRAAHVRRQLRQVAADDRLVDFLLLLDLGLALFPRWRAVPVPWWGGWARGGAAGGGGGCRRCPGWRAPRRRGSAPPGPRQAGRRPGPACGGGSRCASYRRQLGRGSACTLVFY